MKALKWLAVGLVGLIVTFFVVGYLLPSEYQVERSIVVSAPAEVVFDHVNDRAKHIEYSPWDDDDPTMKLQLGEVTVGEGATYSWTSDKAEPGTVTITKSTPHTRIEEDLDFGTEPAKAWWTFEEVDGGTEVTWGFGGDMEGNILGRYFATGIDSMVGPYFEKGLEGLKAAAEAAPPAEADPAEATDATETEAAEG